MRSLQPALSRHSSTIKVLTIAAASALMLLLASLLLAPAALAKTVKKQDERVDLKQVPILLKNAEVGKQQRSIPSQISAIQELPFTAQMLGVTWRGDSTGLALRTRANKSAKWSQWIQLSADHDGPDANSAEYRRARKLNAIAVPINVDVAKQVQLRTNAGHKIHTVDVVALRSKTGKQSSRRNGSSIRLPKSVRSLFSVSAANAVTPKPLIKSRKSWGATTPRAASIYADRARGIIVHHTVTQNAYKCSAVPAMLRSIQRYHRDSLRWNDIGYNFIIDRCGRVWEARDGGVTRPVIGAHASGFNTGTVGVALLGTHDRVSPTRAAQRALERFIAWRMDVASVLPNAVMTLNAASNDKFKVGQAVRLQAVSGHRDVFPTACPGAITYRQLTQTRRRAAASGGIKVGNVTTNPVYDEETGVVKSVSVRTAATHKNAQITINLERINGEVLATKTAQGRVMVMRHGFASDDVKTWDLRVRITATLGKQRSRQYYRSLIVYEPDPEFVINEPPTDIIVQDPQGLRDGVLKLSYSVNFDRSPSVALVNQVTQEEIPLDAQVTRTARSEAVTGRAVNELNVFIPPTISKGLHELRVGVSDNAPQRSVRTFALTIQ